MKAKVKAGAGEVSPDDAKEAKKRKKAADGPSSTMSISTMYRKLDHREHVLLRPGMYVGSTDLDPAPCWVYDAEARRMRCRVIQYIPALYKIFDEVLMNAIDHSVRLKRLQAADASSTVNLLRNIKVVIDRVDGSITVFNDGEGIDVEVHEEHKCYVPELIFGHLLTSANYDDEQDAARTIGGQNGIGAKACNIFSSSFVVETVDSKRKKLYTQRFCDNMLTVEAPSIKACAKKPYTKISFTPDYARFGLTGLSDDMYALMVKRVYDATAVTDADVSVHLNGERLDCKTFEKYADLYIGDKVSSARFYERLADGFEVIVASTSADEPGGMQQVSFVNGVCTMRGGKHVDYVAGTIARKLSELIQERKKDVQVKPQYIRDNLFLFIKSTVPNPTFDSQSKETLTTPVSKFGVRLDVSDKFIEKLYKLDLVSRAVMLSEATSSKALKKSDGKKLSTITGIPKLDDANWAGTAKSSLCTLILTEGDSAKSMAISGLDQVGRDKFGVFPLRGKVMNVCEVSAQKIADNKEISELKKILGLETNKVYTSAGDLRYGRIMALTDADADGSHIKGLIMNLFQQLWPSLLKLEGFMTSMLTPIVKARRMQGGKEVVLEFFNTSDFERWRRDGQGIGINDDTQNAEAQKGSETLNPKKKKSHAWDIKYYKGLGTSTAKEAKEYFRKMRMVCYQHTGKFSDDVLDLAFNKKRADDRKAWLMQYNKDGTLDYGNSDVPFESFVNKDLIHFSNYDLVRSIPHVVDGFKVSQRKVLFAVLKRGISRQEIRVASLSGIVQAEAAYHHGDASLNGTIVGLAQNFVGSNNVNLLQPNGQFGTRIQGGKDSASPRYIHTLLSPIAARLFSKDDEAVLHFLDDDGQSVEPSYYAPILPMILINGAIGIGTGFSTNVPCYNPLDILRCIRCALAALPTPSEPTPSEPTPTEPTPTEPTPTEPTPSEPTPSEPTPSEPTPDSPDNPDSPEGIISEALARSSASMVPWYRGFTGAVQRIDVHRFLSRGIYSRTSLTQVLVTELPVGTWTEDFKELLDALVQNDPDLKKIDSNYGDESVSFTLHYASKAALDAALAPIAASEAASGGGPVASPNIMYRCKLEKDLKLASNKYLSTNNMYLFDAQGKIKRYESIAEIMVDFWHVRLEAYASRKRHVLESMMRAIRILEGKVTFLQAVVSGELIVTLLSKAQLESRLGEMDLLKVDGGYDYIIRMPIYSLTEDKKRELEDELAGKRAAHAAYGSKTPQQLWREDLDALEPLLDAHMDRAASSHGPDAGHGHDADDDDEDEEDSD